VIWVQMAGSALRMRALMLRTEAARNPDLGTCYCDTCRRYLHKYPSQCMQRSASIE
jgi:hypothetical protein